MTLLPGRLHAPLAIGSFNRKENQTAMFVQLKKDFLGKPAGERIDVADSDGQTLIEQGIAELANPGEAVNQLMTKAMAAATAKISQSTPPPLAGAPNQFRDSQPQPPPPP